MYKQLNVAAVLLFACMSATAGTIVQTSVFAPPVCTVPPFSDVAISSPFCPWIQQLAADSITLGCGSGNFCPDSPVTRAQMAVFLETAMRGTATWDAPQVFTKLVVVSAVSEESLDNGAALMDAIAALDQPSSSNPYVLYVEQGTYAVAGAVVLPAGVSLRGAPNGTTNIQASSVGGAAFQASQAEIADVVIETNGDTYTAFLADGVKLRNVTLRSEGASPTGFSGTAQMTDCRLQISGSGTVIGIADTAGPFSHTSILVVSSDGSAIGMSGFGFGGSDLRLEVIGSTLARGVEAVSSVGFHDFEFIVTSSAVATGVRAGDDMVLLHGKLKLSAANGVTIAVNGVSQITGVDVTSTSSAPAIAVSSATLVLRDSHIEAVAPMTSTLGSSIKTKNSTFSASGVTAISTDGTGTLKIASSEIKGSVTGGGAIVCHLSYNENLQALARDCTVEITGGN